MTAASTDYTARAIALFDAGYNCAQAVFVAFAADLGLDEATALRVASSLGGGLGHNEICGAALGMCLGLGLAQGPADADPQAKQAHAQRTRAAIQAFADAFGATGCEALKQPGNRAACHPYVAHCAQAVAAALPPQERDT